MAHELQLPPVEVDSPPVDLLPAQLPGLLHEGAGPLPVDPVAHEVVDPPPLDPDAPKLSEWHEQLVGSGSAQRSRPSDDVIDVHMMGFAAGGVPDSVQVQSHPSQEFEDVYHRSEAQELSA